MKKVPDKIPEIQYKRILYTTDLSESGRHAFPHAVSLSKKFGSELVALHVVEGGPELDRRLFGYVDEKLWEQIKTRNLKEAREILINRKRSNAEIEGCVGEYCEEVKSSMPETAEVKYKIMTRMGDPAEIIIEEAEKGKFDLIIMSSHGHGLVSSVTGGTVRQVLKHSAVPVLVVRVPRKA